VGLNNIGQLESGHSRLSPSAVRGAAAGGCTLLDVCSNAETST